MEKLVDKIIISDYETLENDLKEIPLDKQIGLTVILNEIKYEFLVHIKSNNDNLLCLGPSGLPSKQQINKFKSRPFFFKT